MAGVETRSFESPDETRTPDKTTVEVVHVGGTTVGRATLQPGWRWSETIKAVVGTDDCQVHHLGVVLSGQMHVVHSDGSEADVSAGEVYVIQPGHDAWVVGDDPAVAVEFDARTAVAFAQG
jgi:mannose-6-phosphate isomerase-like protein (cupin superfamily)